MYLHTSVQIITVQLNELSQHEHSFVTYDTIKKVYFQHTKSYAQASTSLSSPYSPRIKTSLTFNIIVYFCLYTNKITQNIVTRVFDELIYKDFFFPKIQAVLQVLRKLKWLLSIFGIL